jgi:hypothetical protein
MVVPWRIGGKIGAGAIRFAFGFARDRCPNPTMVEATITEPAPRRRAGAFVGSAPQGRERS